MSLCVPTPELTCFGCCPPIRPAGYDPVHYVRSLRRLFSDNRRAFLTAPPAAPKPIVGYHCWALGFLDRQGRRVGCLLHPARNEGNDQRYLTDFARVCAGETCFPARTFAALPVPAQQFWLSLASGLSPFYFSSRRANPLFHILRWGPLLLEAIRQEANAAGWNATELLWRRPVFSEPRWRPRAHRYLFRVAWQQGSADSGSELWAAVGRRSKQILALLNQRKNAFRPTANGNPCGFVHQLPIRRDFADFLRLCLGWRQRVSLADVTRVADWIAPRMETRCKEKTGRRPS